MKKASYLLILLVLLCFKSLSSNYLNGNDTIYFKGNFDYPPYQLIDNDGKPTGFSVEVLQAIAKTMGLKVNIELNEWNLVRSELESGKIDGVAAISYSSERSKLINFTSPYIYITHAVFVRNESHIKSFDDINDKQVIVVKGDIMHDYLITNNITKFIVPVKDYKTAMRLLSAGEYDCAVINKLQGQFSIQKYQLSNLMPVGASVQPREICFGIKKGREDLLAQINDGLQIIKTTGEYDKIYEKWFGVYEKTDIRSQVLKTIGWVLIPILFVLFWILVWSYSLRKQVASKTSELQKELNERKKAENQLIQEKALMDSMINSIPDLIFYKDRNNTYLGCNEAFCKFNEMTYDQIIGKSDFEIFSKEQAGYFHDTDKKVIEGREIFRAESWETNTKGEKYLLDTLKVPFTDKNGVPLGIVGVCHDITERHKNEIDLKNAKEKAEESDRLKSSFLANMSHEIRTPMNAIIGFSDLLVDPDTNIDEREELVSHINNNCNTLLHLIDDIIDLAKIEANELSIFIKETDVNKVLNDVFNNFNESKRKTEKNFIDLKLNKENYKENFILNTDPYRFNQILTNLIDNGLKYTEYGFVEFGYKIIEDINLVEFFIKDTGIGIPKNKQNDIFQRFNKLEDSNTKLYRGTGLGLTITQNLIIRLGGTIRVDSEVNKGSTFYFTLPLDISKNIEMNKLKADLIQNHENWEGKTILIAEDEESNYRFLEMLLKNKGLTLLKAENGYEAIEIFNAHKNIDLILMDIKMPGMNGLEATMKIKKIDPKVPIIIQTAYAMQNDEKISHDAGCDDYISKPINKEKLLKLLNKWIGQ